MIRNVAVTIAVIALIVIFQPYIKAGILEGQNALALARIEVSEDKKAELRKAISRIADGYQDDSYSEVELITLKEHLAELRSHSGGELTDAQADALLSRIDTILLRYKL